jgi:GNAT superfamily N-acetyltransferase
MYRIDVARPEQMEGVRSLFRDYWAELGVSPCFQNFDSELATLPGAYDPILLIPGVACAALRPLAPNIGEMKRLYVRPAHRGKGLGRLLTEAITREARARNYQLLRLDTLPQLQTAITMYRAMGFRETAPYYENPDAGILFMELDLWPQTTRPAESSA